MKIDSHSQLIQSKEKKIYNSLSFRKQNSYCCFFHSKTHAVRSNVQILRLGFLLYQVHSRSIEIISPNIFNNKKCRGCDSKLKSNRKPTKVLETRFAQRKGTHVSKTSLKPH
jgi:hypothetical protein